MPVSGEGRRMTVAEPVGPVVRAPEPIPVLAMLRRPPPYGDGGPIPRDAVAVAWTRAQVQVQRSAEAEDTALWLPVRDVHRVRDVADRTPVTARLGLAEVPGLRLREATSRRGEVVAVRVLLAPGTDDAHERWLLVADLVDVDPADDVP
jgi:hypothetical protein